MSNFSTANKVNSMITATDEVEFQRSLNRDKISRAINGFPPLNAEQAKAIGMKVNVNWLESSVIAKQAMLQFFNAFSSQNNFFSVQLPMASPEKKTVWELMITGCINREMKLSKQFSNLLDSCWSSVVVHGIAPMIWLKRDEWLPDFIALNDFRVPTDTDTSLDNMTWFAIRRRYTIGELVKAAYGKYAHKGWDKKIVAEILQQYWDKNFENVDYDWSNSPEKMSELVKQNMMYYTSDATPVITLWHFYHLSDEEPESGKWMMKVVPDKSVEKADKEKFVFDSDKPVADCIDNLLHIQFGDLNGTPPFKIPSVRSLGFMLHEPCYWTNMTRNRALQYMWENFNTLFRGADGSSKALASKIELFDKGWIPNDVQIVPKEQRHQIDQGFVQLMLSQMKQLMGEASLSYTQKSDTGTQRERTLGEAQIQMQQANALMTGLLAVASRNIVFLYREICRRFCDGKSLNPKVRKFQEKCRKAGISKNLLNPELWDIHPETPLGNGNQTLQMAQASQLMSVRGAHSPDAQMEILHMYDAAITQNPRLAQRLVPLGKGKDISDGQRWASTIFGTLMQGVPVPVVSEINPIDQIQTLLAMASGVISRIEQTDNMGTREDVVGLMNVFQYVGQLMQWLAQDENQKSLVKQMGDSMGQLQNIVKGFAQRQQEAGQQSQAEPPEIPYAQAPDDIKRQLEAKAGLQPSREPQTDPKTAKAIQQMSIKNQQHEMNSQHKQADFLAEQHRRSMETQAEINRQALEQGAKIAISSEDKSEA
jgi:hypothetical protein